MSFFANLFGGKSGKEAANAAAAAQQAANTQARGDLTTGFSQARSRINPLMQTSQRGFDAYNDAIGVNGAEGYGRAKSTFDADPFRAGEQDATNLAIRDTFRRYNSRGMGNSGASGAAVGRVGAERYGQQVADYRTRLAGAGSLAPQLATTMAGFDTGEGAALSGNSMNVGNIEANRLMQIEQAAAQGRSNLLGTIGAGANLLMAGFAPNAGGKTAFGSMRNALMPSRPMNNWSTTVYPG